MKLFFILFFFNCFNKTNSVKPHTIEINEAKNSITQQRHDCENLICYHYNDLKVTLMKSNNSYSDFLLHILYIYEYSFNMLCYINNISNRYHFLSKILEYKDNLNSLVNTSHQKKNLYLIKHNTSLKDFDNYYKTYFFIQKIELKITYLTEKINQKVAIIFS